MAPTVQTARRDDRDREKRSRPGEKRSELVSRVKYNNTLPDIPFDPKFITYPFETNRFYTYKPTSLERSFKYDLLTEHDLGVNIDLINPETYKIDPNAYPGPEDERLLEEDLNALSDSKRSRHHNTSVSWLRKTEYISTEYNRFIQKADKSEAKVGFNIKKLMKEEELYKDRESQIAAINKTFEQAKQPITKHYSKPGVTPVQVLDVFPDFQLWKHPFAQVLFDSDPAPKGYSAPVQMEEMSQAMIRGAVDESGEQFVAYFLPTDETLGKRKRDFEGEKEYEPEENYEYMLAREYNWNVKNKLSKGYEETYFFIIRENGVFYNELETRVRLSKRRKTNANTQLRSRLIVKHRELIDKELAAQEGRLQMLEPPGEEEEEEEEQMPSLTAEVQSEELQERSDQESEDDERTRRRKRRKVESDDEEADKASVKSGGSRRSGSRSRSRSRSGSRSRSRSRSKSKSGSPAKSRSRSRSRSKSGSPARSASRSRSRSRSKSGSPARSGSGSRSRSRSRSKSGSPASKRSGSPARSRSRSKSASRSRSRSGSPAKRSRSRSGSGSPARNSRSRSKSGSPASRRSGSGSRSRSRSRSKSKSPSRSRSRSASKSGSERGSGSEGEEEEDKGKKDEEEIFGSDSD